jgi:predicted dehydrogenase
LGFREGDLKPVTAPFKAALVGCGKIGSAFADDPLIEGIYSHAAAYQACPETALVAVCDSDPAALARCGERWQVEKQYTDFRAMLAMERPEILSVCTPDDTHYEIIRTVLGTPGLRGVLAEKPLALHVSEAEELVSEAAARGVTLAVNFSRRYAPSHVRLREHLQAGKIGRIQALGGCYTKGTIHNGSHWFDLARFLVGEVVRVWGFDARKEGDDDPTLDAVLEFAGGVTGHLQACDANAFAIFEMDVIGTRGRVRLTDSGHQFETHMVADSPHYSGYRSLTPAEVVRGGFGDVALHAVADLVECVKTGARPRASATDGLAALRIAAAVRESARSGCAVSVDAG